MKKYFLVVLLAIFAISCSKKVDVKAKINGGSPLDRMEIIDASSIATLPLTNIGLGKDGFFTGSFEAPKNGMYVISYGGSPTYVYLKGGQKLEFSAEAVDVPGTIKFVGEVQKNNDFLKQNQQYVSQYTSKMDMGGLLTKKEPEFLKDAQKIKADFDKNIDEIGKKTGADSDLLSFKKDEVTASILGLLAQYEINHPMATQNTSFKVSQAFKDYVKTLEKDNDKLTKEQPIYKQYLLAKYSSDFQQFAKNVPQKDMTTNSEMFSKFLDTRKDISDVTKDYLLAFIMGQYDINPALEGKSRVKLEKIIDEKIKDNTVKTELKKLIFVITGPAIGQPAVENGLVKQDGKSFKFTDDKTKPTLVAFYASYNPYISQAVAPVLKEVSNFYKSKMNFVYVNLDDTKDQFTKTSTALLKGITGTNVYAEGGINSKFAADWGVYSFKMPSFIILDKEGKVASKMFSNLGDPSFVAEMDKITGLKAPMVAPSAQQMPNILNQGQGGEQAPPPPPPAQAQPATK